MKKLLIGASLVVMSAAPALAEIGYWTPASKATPPAAKYTIVDRDMKNDTIRTVVTREPRPIGKLVTGEDDFRGKYALSDGRHLLVEDKNSAYILEADGSRFYAPKGAYTIQSGVTFFSEDGQIVRMETPPTIVYVDAGDLTGETTSKKD